MFRTWHGRTCSRRRSRTMSQTLSKTVSPITQQASTAMTTPSRAEPRCTATSFTSALALLLTRPARLLQASSLGCLRPSLLLCTLSAASLGSAAKGPLSTLNMSPLNAVTWLHSGSVATTLSLNRRRLLAPEAARKATIVAGRRNIQCRVKRALIVLRSRRQRQRALLGRTTQISWQSRSRTAYLALPGRSAERGRRKPCLATVEPSATCRI